MPWTSAPAARRGQARRGRPHPGVSSPAGARAAEFLLRLLGAVGALVLMVWLLAWSLAEVAPVRVAVAWVGWCVALRVWGLATGTRPGRVVYLLAAVPAAAPYLIGLLVLGVWGPLAGG